MSKLLNISRTLTLPLDAVTRRLAWLGTIGSGKSYGAMKLAEQMLKAKAQVICLDPVGIWWSLRLDKDGKSPGFEIPVFGGLHGDYPLEPGAGKIMADFIADKGLSIVLDTSGFEHDTEKARFASAFAERFFFRKKSKPSAVHINIEEAQEFLPQEPGKEEKMMLHHLVRMWKIGRNFGIGGSLISQRPQELSKKALNLSQCVFAFQTNGTHERKAIEEWMKDNALSLDIASDLPKLKVGEPHVWAPGWLGISETVRISERQTFDASNTPEVGVTFAKTELSPIELQKISEEIQSMVERAKEEDPAELQRKIREQQAHIKRLEVQAAKPVETKLETVVDRREIEQYGKNVVLATRKYQDAVRKIIDSMSASIESVLRQIGELRGIQITLPVVTPAPTKLIPPTPFRITKELGIIPAPEGRHRQIEANRAYLNASLSPGQKAILTAAAQHYPEEVDRGRLSVLCGYKRSSRNTYIQQLSGMGYVTISNDSITATQEGIAALGPSFTPLPRGQELVDHWLSKLSPGERAIFELLIERYPQAVERSALDEDTTYKRSSRNTYIQKLSARHLIVIQGTRIKASDTLFA